MVPSISVKGFSVCAGILAGDKCDKQKKIRLSEDGKSGSEAASGGVLTGRLA
jgi:hypothetical protein